VVERLSKAQRPQTPTIDRVKSLHPTIAPQISLCEWIAKRNYRICEWMPDPQRPGKGLWMPLGWDSARIVAAANNIDLGELGREQAVVAQAFGEMVKEIREANG
jgi:hypothetical protein